MLGTVCYHVSDRLASPEPFWPGQHAPSPTGPRGVLQVGDSGSGSRQRRRAQHKPRGGWRDDAFYLLSYSFRCSLPLAFNHRTPPSADPNRAASLELACGRVRPAADAGHLLESIKRAQASRTAQRFGWRRHAGGSSGRGRVERRDGSAAAGHNGELDRAR